MNIEIPDEHIETLKQIYETKRDSLVAELFAIESVLGQLYSGDRNYGLKTDKSEIKSISTLLVQKMKSGYPYNGSWIEKIMYVLTYISSLTTAEIADYICSIEDHSEKRKVISSISSILSANSKDGGILLKRQNNKKEFVYSTGYEGEYRDYGEIERKMLHDLDYHHDDLSG